MEDSKRLHHIFDEPQHNLEPVVRACGGQPAAYRAITDAVNAALASGELVVGRDGRFNQEVEVAGHRVTVKGRVLDGVVRLGTAWIAA